MQLKTVSKRIKERDAVIAQACYCNAEMHALHPAHKASIFRLRGSACVHTLVWPLPHRPVQLGWTCQESETPTDIALGSLRNTVWPLPHRPVQLGWTCQECETPTDIALGVTEARKPSHHFTVHAKGHCAKIRITISRPDTMLHSYSHDDIYSSCDVILHYNCIATARHQPQAMTTYTAAVT